MRGILFPVHATIFSKDISRRFMATFIRFSEILFKNFLTFSQREGVWYFQNTKKAVELKTTDLPRVKSSFFSTENA